MLKAVYCLNTFSRPVLAKPTNAPRAEVFLARMASTSGASQARMSDEQKFFFDLNGFLHVRGALSKEEVERMNKAIDEHSGEIKAGVPPELRAA